jgi:hypothetical protein
VSILFICLAYVGEQSMHVAILLCCSHNLLRYDQFLQSECLAIAALVDEFSEYEMLMSMETEIAANDFEVKTRK